MPGHDRYAQFLAELWPLHRTLVSDDTDRAVGKIMAFLEHDLGVPKDLIQVHEFPSGMELSTWITPQKYVIRHFSLRQLGATEKTVIDSRQTISLALAEYSQPTDVILNWDELSPHLFVSERRPEAIPFVFKYFYRPNWGFCLPKTTHDALDKNARFQVRIDTAFEPGTLKCLEVVLPGAGDESLLAMSNLCHPHQVNDSITGVINNLMLIEHFLERRSRHTLRFGFWPETIGAMAYFTRYRSERKLFRQAIFTEMLGTGGIHALQFSRQESASIDRAAVHVLERSRPQEYRSGRFTTVLRNDERISNGINLDIPTISLSRYPYAEYHTSDDNPSIIDMRNLAESFEVTRDLLTIVDEDDTLIAEDRLYGQPFLTRYKLFNDPPLAGGNAQRDLNKIMEDVFSYSDGRTSLLQIADRFGYSFQDVKFLARGLVDNGLFRSQKEKP